MLFVVVLVLSLSLYSSSALAGSCNPKPVDGSCNPIAVDGSCNPKSVDGSCNPIAVDGSCNPIAVDGSCNPKPVDGSCNPKPVGTDTDGASDVSALLQQLVASGTMLRFRFTPPAGSEAIFPGAQSQSSAGVVIAGHVVVEAVPSEPPAGHVVAEPTLNSAADGHGHVVDESGPGTVAATAGSIVIEGHVVVEDASPVIAEDSFAGTASSVGEPAGAIGVGKDATGRASARGVVARSGRMERRYRV